MAAATLSSSTSTDISPAAELSSLEDPTTTSPPTTAATQAASAPSSSSLPSSTATPKATPSTLSVIAPSTQTPMTNGVDFPPSPGATGDDTSLDFDASVFEEDSKSVATEGSDHLDDRAWDSPSDDEDLEPSGEGGGSGKASSNKGGGVSTGRRKGNKGEAVAMKTSRARGAHRVDTGKSGSTPKGTRWFRRKDPISMLSAEPLEEEEEEWQRRAVGDGRHYYYHFASGLKRWYEAKEKKIFKVNDRVEINYKDRGVWYPSTIRSVDFVGKGQVEYDYGVEYDDTPNSVFGQYEHKIRPLGKESGELG